jgi:hypothetical protein
MQNVIEDAGTRLDAAARHIMARDGLDYRSALIQAARKYPKLYESYTSGVRTPAKQYDQLSGSEQLMVILQNDADRVRYLAGNILNTAALRIAGSSNSSAGIAQVSPDSYRDALVSLQRQFPSLARASEDGYIAADDWSLLCTLIPSVSSEVKSRFGAEPLNLRSDNYVSSHGVRRYDRDGNEYRTYVR